MTDSKTPWVSPEARVAKTEQDKARERNFYLKLGGVAAAIVLTGVVTLGAIAHAADVPQVPNAPKIESEKDVLGAVDPLISGVVMPEGTNLYSEPNIDTVAFNVGDPSKITDHVKDSVDYFQSPNRNVSVKDLGNGKFMYSVVVNGKQGWVSSDQATAVREDKKDMRSTFK